MANLTSAININVPTEVKEEANKIFKSLGLNMSSAMNMFLNKVIYEKGIPFDLKLEPSSDTIEALKELDDIENGRVEYKRYHSVSELFEDLDNE